MQPLPSSALTDEDDLPSHLTCPYSHDLFEQPIALPCCGQAISRPHVVAWFASKQGEKTCPMCRASLKHWDPANAVILRNLVDGVEAHRKASANPPAAAPANGKQNAGASVAAGAAAGDEQQWAAVLNPVTDVQGNLLPISELKLSLEKAVFAPRPSLFIAVVDRSGSMAGSPWRQVQDGLLHMVALSRNNAFVRMEIIAYESSAQLIDIGRHEADAVRVIRGMSAGGGTNFVAAFNRVEEVLRRYVCVPEVTQENAQNNVSNVTIAFLTDGQADTNRAKLTDTFRTMLAERWSGPLSVHAIGFGRECDKPFLEEMWKTGPQPGTFRYAEPDENGDLLSRKLTHLFEHCSRFSTVSMKLQLIGLGKPFSAVQLSANNAAADGATTVLEVQFPLGENRRGTYSCWLTGPYDPNSAQKRQVTITSPVDRDVQVPVQDGYRLPAYKLIQRALFGRWVAALTDALASELLEISVNRAGRNAKITRLHATFLEQKIVAMMRQVPDGDPNAQATRERLQILEREAGALAQGAAINAGQVGDLRFGAQYVSALPAAGAKPAAIVAPPAAAPPVLEQRADHDEAVVRFSRSARTAGRSELQTKVVQVLCDWTQASRNAIPSLEGTTQEQLLHRDSDGNNVLMLAAYCGHRRFIRELLVAANRQFAGEQLVSYLNALNGSPAPGESALTIAIKARGFTECVTLLTQAGARLPAGRRQALSRFCIDRGFVRTAAALSSGSDEEIPMTAGAHFTTEFLTYNVHRIVRAGLQAKADWGSYLAAALHKSATELVKLILQSSPTEVRVDVFEHLWDLCVLDDTDAEKPRLAEMLIAYLKEKWGSPADSKLRSFINQAHSESGDTLLFHAADKGSPLLLALALRLGAEVDKTNKLGNTPLWIACERRWPCIIDTLLLSGADPNRANEKGNSPLITICQKGTKQLAEKLLAHGADVNTFNSNNGPGGFNINGDTALLICCRCGQYEVLRLLLPLAEPRIANHSAKIDGFNTLLAATEADRADCIRVLHEFGGLNLEHRTAPDNEIIAGATSLHLAAYYGRENAMRMLLDLGANPNALDIHGQTPLHTAVIRGQPAIVKLLRGRSNADLRDLQGNTAATYCRNEELRRVLINPLLDPLVDLARGGFGADQAAACEVLRKSSLVGCLSCTELLDMRTFEGRSPLAEAVIHSNLAVVEAFLMLDSSPASILRTDWYGIDAWNWAHITSHVRLKILLQSLLSVGGASVAPATAHLKLREVLRQHPSDAQILYLGTAPTASVAALRQSDLCERMHGITKLNKLASVATDGANDASASAATKDDNVVPVKQAVARASEAQQQWQWDAKVFTVGKVIEGKSPLSPRQIAALYMYDRLGHGVTLEQAPNSDQHLYAQLVLESLRGLAPYEGEVYVGMVRVDRSMFLPDSCLALGAAQGFLSASSVWCVATEAVKDFTAKKKGVVFLIHSRTGRPVSSYSRHAYDMEVLFAPPTRFRVLRWYRGDVICLGQANIRQHTFGIKDPAEYVNSDAALIIEMQEVPY